VWGLAAPGSLRPRRSGSYIGGEAGSWAGNQGDTLKAVPPPIPRSTFWDSLPSWIDPVLFLVLAGLLGMMVKSFLLVCATFPSSDGVGAAGAFLFFGVLFPPVSGVVCVTLALALYRRRYRVFASAALVVALLLGTPMVNVMLARSIGESDWWNADAIAADEARSRLERQRKLKAQQGTRLPMTDAEMKRSRAIDLHYENLHRKFLQARQTVARVEDGFVVLDDGTVLSLYGFRRTEELSVALKMEDRNLLGEKKVLVRIPGQFMFRQGYQPVGPEEPGGPSLLAHAPTDRNGWRYGVVPSLLYVDGTLFNSRLVPAGSPFPFHGYESPRPPERIRRAQ